MHQPDPSLTVQELSQNPQISFRKGSHILDQNTIESEETTIAPPFKGQYFIYKHNIKGAYLGRLVKNLIYP